MSSTDAPDPERTYREILDALVGSSGSVSARLLREEGIAGRGECAAAANDLARRLSPADREVLAQVLDRERESAFHDLLAELTWWMDCRDVTWCVGGKEMPKGYEGGLHCDYVGRRSGWSWP